MSVNEAEGLHVVELNLTYGNRIVDIPRKVRTALYDTVRIYRDAVGFLVGVADAEWDWLSERKGKMRNNAFERLFHRTKSNPEPKYAEFDAMFPKMPSYLRRQAASVAMGHVSSQRSNCAAWEAGGCAGKPPRLGKSYHDWPVLYGSNMFGWDFGSRTAKVKVFMGNDWVWAEVNLRKCDVDYAVRHLSGWERGCPMLVREGHAWELRHCYTKEVELTGADAQGSVVCSVDLGVNCAATCCVMSSDGTVLARRFIRLPSEEDRLGKALGKLKRAQKMGARQPKAAWARVNAANDDLTLKTAGGILAFAREWGCDVVVMEHLDMQGKVSGTRRQRLAVWRKRGVFRRVAAGAHKLGMRVSTVNAAYTSRLAFDGTGEVARGLEMVDDPELRRKLDAKALSSLEYDALKRQNPYGTCRFATGKVYSCDLNAAYNIGARYFIRGILKTLDEKTRFALQAKVPAVARRTTCTLSTLISLRAELASSVGFGSAA